MSSRDRCQLEQVASRGGVNVFRKNEQIKEALGITGIYFQFYRAGRAHWRIVLETKEEFTVTTPHLGSTESTVLRVVAEKMAKEGRPVRYA